MVLNGDYFRTIVDIADKGEVSLVFDGDDFKALMDATVEDD
jgi:hypothetical protein